MLKLQQHLPYHSRTEAQAATVRHLRRLSGPGELVSEGGWADGVGPWRLGHAGGSSVHLLEAYKPLVEPASAPVLAAAVSSMMAPDVLGAAPVRGHHLGTVELTDCCTLQVRVGAAIDMWSRGRAVRGRESAPRSQKSSFPLRVNVL